MKVQLYIAFFILLIIPLGWFFATGPEPIRLQPVMLEVSPVNMGVIPFLQPDKLREQMAPVYSYLEKKLGRPVQLTTVSDYESLARLLELKKVHIAWFSHASYEKLKDDHPWQILCRPVQYGSVLYQGQIIVRHDSQFNSVHDLRGQTFAYVDRYSGSGFFFPNLYLASQGIQPLDFFSKVFFTQSHRNSILGVLDGTYAAAAVFSASLLHQSDQSLKVIARTGPIPNDPFVVRDDLDADLKSKIEHAMLTMHEDPEGVEFLKILKELRGTEKFVSEIEVQESIKTSQQK